MMYPRTSYKNFLQLTTEDRLCRTDLSKNQSW